MHGVLVTRTHAVLPYIVCCMSCMLGRHTVDRCRPMARRTRAQSGEFYSSGGVISMDKGTVLFDGVAISGTEATDVRVGGQRCVPGRCAWWAVWADGVHMGRGSGGFASAVRRAISAAVWLGWAMGLSPSKAARRSRTPRRCALVTCCKCCQVVCSALSQAACCMSYADACTV